MNILIKYPKKCSSVSRWKILGGFLIATELIILITMKLCQVSSQFAFSFLTKFFNIIIFFEWSSTIVLTLVCFYRIAVSLIFMIVWPLVAGEELRPLNYISIGMQIGWNSCYIVTQECYISHIHSKQINIRWIRTASQPFRKTMSTRLRIIFSFSIN